MYTVFYSLGTHKNITGYNQQLLQHLKGYKPKVVVSTITIYPVCFEAFFYSLRIEDFHTID